MRKTARRRWIGLSLGAVLVAGLMTLGFSLRGRTLTEMARVVGPLNPDRQRWNWLSDEELLVVTTDNTFPKEVNWHGHAEIRNIVTGEIKPLPGLTAVLNRDYFFPDGIPSDFRRSPNRTWLVWQKCLESGGGSFPVVAHLDGTHYRELSYSIGKDSEMMAGDWGAFLDDRHWIDLSDYFASRKVSIYDLQESSKDRRCASTASPVRAACARYTSLHPPFACIDFAWEKGSVEIGLYRMEEADTFSLLMNATSYKGRRLISKRTLKLPQETYRFEGSPAPQQQGILYHLQSNCTHPTRAFLHRCLPAISADPVLTESLWLSQIDGQGFHEIGRVIVPTGSAARAIQTNTPFSGEIAHVEWLPGGKQVSFLYRHNLYVMPVK